MEENQGVVTENNEGATPSDANQELKNKLNETEMQLQKAKEDVQILKKEIENLKKTNQNVNINKELTQLITNQEKLIEFIY